jgi:NADH-quinone oxidoreductase subunit J
VTVTLSEWFSEVANWVFLVIALPTLFAALRMVTTSNIVRAVLYLVVTLAGTAALFLVLGAEFVAWTVVLVYIGAVIILFLIGIMITRAPLTSESPLSHDRSVRLSAALLSLVIFGVMAWAFIDAFDNRIIPFGDDATRSADLAVVLFDRFVIPFEVVSFVLLAALIGGIAIARQDPIEERDR